MSVIGKERRTTINQNNQLPGPGQYDPLIDVKSSMQLPPKWTMHGTKNRDIPIIKDIPGPGQYETQNSHSQRAPLMQGRYHSSDREDLHKPGPTNYKTDISELSKIGFTMGRSKRDHQRKERSPGPGEYNAGTQTQLPCYSMGKELRSHKELISSVGPGSYDIPTTLKINRGWMILPRRDRVYSTVGPGPNAYPNVYNHKERVKCYKIGTSKREGLAFKSDSPGPACYEPKKVEQSKGYSLGKGKRLAEQIEELPGPGQYDPKKMDHVPKFSMLQRYQEKQDIFGPGPQSYSINEMKETKNVLFSKSKRDQGNIENIPGPGSYYQDKKTSKHGIVFGKEKRSQSKSEYMPGPGQYKVKSMFDNLK